MPTDDQMDQVLGQAIAATSMATMALALIADISPDHALKVWGRMEDVLRTLALVVDTRPATAPSLEFAQATVRQAMQSLAGTAAMQAARGTSGE